MSGTAWRPRIGAIVWTVFTVVFVLAAVSRLLSGAGNPLLPALVLAGALLGGIGIWRVLARDDAPPAAPPPPSAPGGGVGKSVGGRRSPPPSEPGPITPPADSTREAPPQDRPPAGDVTPAAKQADTAKQAPPPEPDAPG